MDKKIIYEIYRQHEIMGVDKKILKENKFVTLGTDLIKDFITKTQKTIPNVVDDVLIGSIRVNKQLVNDILDVLEDPSLFDILSKSEKELFGKIVSQSGEIVDDVYEKLMRDVITQTGKNERALIDTISKATAGGKTISEVLNQMNGEEDVFLNAVLTQKIAKKIRDVKTGKFSPEVTVSNKTFVDPTTGLEWSSPDVLMIQKQLTKFQKLLKTVGVSGATKYLKDALKVYEPFWIQFIRNWWSNLLFNWKKVQQINITKAKDFIQNAYSLEKEGKNNEAVRELQKALSQILIFKKEPATDVDQIIKAFITENPNLDAKTKDMFLSSTAAGNKTIKDFISAISDDVHKQVTKPLKDEVNSFIELIPGAGALMKKDLNLVNTAKESLTTPLQRWFNLITWKDPRGAYEVILAMAKRGVNKEVSARLASFFLAHVVVIPGVISLFKTWGDNITSSTRVTYLQALKKLCDEKLLTDGCEDINNELSSIQFMFSEDYVKNYLAALPFDFGKLFGQEMWDEGKQYFNENIFFMTYWDDIVNQIYSIVQGSPFPFVGKPNADKIINVLENTSKKVSDELRKLGINPNAEDLTKEIEDFYKKSGEKLKDLKNTTSPTGQYSNDKEGLVKFLGPDYDSQEDRDEMTQNGNDWTFKGVDGKIRTFKFDNGTFTETTSVKEHFINKNNMKNNLQSKIHNLLTQRLNEQRRRKQTQQTQTSGLPAWTNDYPCLSDIGTITKTKSDNQVLNMDNNGNKQYFFRNFVYKNVLANNTKVEGTWECKNGGLFIKTDDGSQWEKSAGWVNQSGNTTNTIKKSKFTKCSEKLPIKQYCKNETIRKIQACLKMPKRYQTGNFGPITQEYLESRDQNGTLITTETIINVCGSNHPLVTNGGNTNVGTTNTGVPYSAGLNTGTATGEKQTAQSKTGYEDYTVDEIEYSKDVTKPSVASEKPEGETSTGYEGYSEEPKNKPAKSINRPPLQSVQNPAPTVNRGLSQIRPK